MTFLGGLVVGVLIGAFVYMLTSNRFWEGMYDRERIEHWKWFDKYYALLVERREAPKP
jgi:hypothetical protein